MPSLGNESEQNFLRSVNEFFTAGLADIIPRIRFASILLFAAGEADANLFCAEGGPLDSIDHARLSYAGMEFHQSTTTST